MAFDYTGYQIRLGTLMAVDVTPTAAPTDPYFQAILPACIDYAEQRIYRELNPALVSAVGTATLAVGSRSLTLPEGTYVVQSLAVTQVSGAPVPYGTATELYPVDQNYLESVFPPAYTQAQGQPQCYYILDDGTALIGPYADQPYTFSVIYTMRPKPLSDSNTTTILTQRWPDLFLAASMCFMAGYQKNFGAQADDPKMAMSWETQYMTLLKGAMEEEARKQSMGAGYTPSRLAVFAGGAAPGGG